MQVVNKNIVTILTSTQKPVNLKAYNSGIIWQRLWHDIVQQVAATTASVQWRN